MEIHPVVFVSSVVIPLIIIAGIMLWTFVVRKRNAVNKKELEIEKIKTKQGQTENELWESLLSYKEKHIDVLQKKVNKEL